MGLALIITLNLGTWDLTRNTNKPYYAGGPPILPDVLPGNVADFPNYTWREYGQRAGALLDAPLARGRRRVRERSLADDDCRAALAFVAVHGGAARS